MFSFFMIGKIKKKENKELTVKITRKNDEVAFNV